MGDKPVIEGTRGVLVWMGLGTPMARGFVAGALVGVAAYALGMPKQCFTEEGELRPFKGVSKDPHATYTHFLAVPVAAAVVAGLCT